MTDWLCPECSATFPNKTQFRYHINNFNHAKALKEAARADKWVAIWQAGTFCDVAKMARRYHIDYEYLRKLLIKKGVLNVRKQGENKVTQLQSGISGGSQDLPPSATSESDNTGNNLQSGNGNESTVLSEGKLSDVEQMEVRLRPEEPIQNQPGSVSNETTN